MKFNKKNISKEELLALYEAIKLPRLIEDKMLSQLRLGMISKWFSSYGQEAISVGVGMAMEEDEFILPMHRNLGIFTSRNLDLKQLFLQFQGKKDGFTKGRDRSFHFGTKKHHVVGMISHLGPQLGIADGIALANLPIAEEIVKKARITPVPGGVGPMTISGLILNTVEAWKMKNFIH